MPMKVLVWHIQGGPGEGRGGSTSFFFFNGRKDFSEISGEPPTKALLFVGNSEGQD